MPLRLCILILFVSNSCLAQLVWQKIDSGLSILEVPSPKKSEYGTNTITIVKIDPRYYNFEMINATAIDSAQRTAAGWCREQNLLAAVNAGMFSLDDKITNTGYLRNYDHVNNAKWNPRYNMVLAFHPKAAGVPPIQLIDMLCDDWPALLEKYDTYVQGLRIVDCRKQIVWEKSAKRWSMVLWGMDSQGNVLWCFTRSPYPVTDFSQILQRLQIGLTKLMYLEGGPEASLFLRHPNKNLLLMGSYETGFREDDHNQVFWNIPNVIGIRRK